MSNEETFHCIDCKFCKLPLSIRICSWFGLEQINAASYRCTREITNYNVIQGEFSLPLIEKPSCYSERISGGRDSCGPSATYWKPKRKKDLFKLLKK